MELPVQKAGVFPDNLHSENHWITPMSSYLNLNIRKLKEIIDDHLATSWTSSFSSIFQTNMNR